MWKCYFACSPLIEDLASFRLETRQQQQKPQLEAGGSGRREEDHLKQARLFSTFAKITSSRTESPSSASSHRVLLNRRNDK